VASGFTVSGRGDLDSLFMARVNAKRADVGYKVAGVDISNRYEPIGNGTPIAATGYKSGGVDLASLFRNISEPLGPAAQLIVGNYELANGTSPAQLSYNSTGTVSCPAATAVTPAGARAYSWLTGGAANQCELMVTVTAGSFTSGTVGAWVNLGTTQLYTRGAAAAGRQSVSFNVQIRNASSGAILATANGCVLTCDRQ
jgi:hypothetical protein